MPATHLFAAIHVADRDAAADWYERLLGKPAELLPNPREAAWRLTNTGWLYVIAGAGVPGTSLATILVDDLDEFVRLAQEGGIAPGPREVNGAGVRTVHFTDPDGNRLQVGQPPQV